MCACVLLPVQLNEMKREVLDTQQLLQEAGYEKAQLQRRLEEALQSLTDKSGRLDGSKKVCWGMYAGCGIGSCTPIT